MSQTLDRPHNKSILDDAGSPDSYAIGQIRFHRALAAGKLKFHCLPLSVNHVNSFCRDVQLNIEKAIAG